MHVGSVLGILAAVGESPPVSLPVSCQSCGVDSIDVSPTEEPSPKSQRAHTCHTGTWPRNHMVMTGYPQNPSKRDQTRQGTSYVEGIFSPVLVLNVGQVYPQTLSMGMQAF